MPVMSQPIVTYFLIIASVVVSFFGFNDGEFFDKGKFHVGAIVRSGEYHRILTSGFLHGDIGHLVFNMLSLYFFADGIELGYGWHMLLIVYFVSLICGNLLALVIHRKHYTYSAIGASGAVSGVIFASIFLIPGGSVYIYFIPIPIPAYIYALFFVAVSIYGIRSQSDNIGHEAHFGGAIAGMLVAVGIYPQAILLSPFLFAAIMVIVIASALFYVMQNR